MYMNKQLQRLLADLIDSARDGLYLALVIFIILTVLHGLGWILLI